MKYRVHDQLYMTVCFWYLVRNDMSSVRVYRSLHYNVPAKHDHVYLVTLYELILSIITGNYFTL